MHYMDKLKQILQKTKPTSNIIDNKQVLTKQKEEFQKRQEEQKRIQDEKKAEKKKELEDFYQYDIRRKMVKKEQQIQQLPIETKEIKKKLRELHQPITLFGESQLARYKRFKKIQDFHLKNPEYDMKIYDEQFQQLIKEKQQFLELDGKYRARLIEPRLGDDISYIKKKMAMIESQKNYPYKNICDQVYLWIHKVLRDWNEILEQKYPTQEQKNKSNASFNRYHESVSDLKGFLVVLRKRGGDQDMITSVYHIMNCCLVRQYTQANDKYIELSIGTAPWPMGVAMLGITVKRNGLRLSHVLTDQVTRKWMQSIKRLISVSQQIYPSEDSMKMVGYSINPII